MRNFLNNPRHLLPDRLRQLASDFPSKIALRNELGEEISHLNLYRAVCSVSSGLRRGKDVKPVAVLCKDPIQMAIGIFSSWFSNRPVVPLRIPKYFNLQ